MVATAVAAAAAGAAAAAAAVTVVAAATVVRAAAATAVVGAAAAQSSLRSETVAHGQPDVRDLEMHMDSGLSAEQDEAMALAESVAEQGDDGVARKVARTDPGNALECLDRAEVQKASAYLETLPADARVDELRNLLELCRAVREQTTVEAQHKHLRQVARSLKITVLTKDYTRRSLRLVSGKISEAFVQRVSALRGWEAVRNRGSSSSSSAALVFPTAPRGGDSDAAEIAGAGGELRRFMVRKTSDPVPEPVECAREKCKRIKDIVTIEDAWEVVRRDEEIPKELKQRVCKVRELLKCRKLRQLLQTYGIRYQYKKGKEVVYESLQWQRYEVQRHVVLELESLQKNRAVPEAGVSSGSREPIGSSSGSAAEPAAPGPSDADYRFEVTPRTLEELKNSLHDERSRAFTPLGEDMAGACLGARLSGSECYRRLLCLRFDMDYTSLPLGAQKLLALTRAACQRERELPWRNFSAEDLAKVLQSAGERHIWLRLLRARTNERASAVDWDEVAEHFALWLQRAAQDSPTLAEAVNHLRRGQAVALVAWWAHLTACSTAANIR